MTQELDLRLTREEACDALSIPPDTFARLEEAGLFRPESDGRFNLFSLAAAIAGHGLRRAERADAKLSEVGTALADVKPALERLATLADRAGLKGEAHGRAMMEVAAFFTTFAEVMNRATAVLQDEDTPPR
ncbi:MAG TPA: hypothetical protein VIL09_01655 [Microvirga sp.]|jgi:hypothetical protein